VLAELLPSAAPPGPLPVLRQQAERLFGALLGNGDRESFLRLNPFLTLLAGAACKRRWARRGRVGPHRGRAGDAPDDAMNAYRVCDRRGLPRPDGAHPDPEPRRPWDWETMQGRPPSTTPFWAWEGGSPRPLPFPPHPRAGPPFDASTTAAPSPRTLHLAGTAFLLDTPSPLACYPR
jgi:hypothetical protein